jgi:hypothetical protein
MVLKEHYNPIGIEENLHKVLIRDISHCPTDSPQSICAKIYHCSIDEQSITHFVWLVRINKHPYLSLFFLKIFISRDKCMGTDILVMKKRILFC